MYTPPDPTKHILIKQLTWEELNTITHNALVPVRNENIHKWFLAAHNIKKQDVMTSINALVNMNLDKDNNSTFTTPYLLGMWTI